MKMRFSACACGSSLDYRSLPKVVEDSSGAMVLLELLRKRDSSGILRLESILNAIRFNRHTDISTIISIFNQASSIFVDPDNGLKSWLNNLKSRFSGVPERVLLAPFLVINDAALVKITKELLQTCSSEFPFATGDYSEGSLTANEAGAVFGISSNTLLRLVRGGYMQTESVGKRIKEFPLQAFCDFYRRFTVNAAARNGHEVSLCPPNKFGRQLNAKLDQLIDGQLVLVKADARDSLTEYLVAPVKVPIAGQKVQAPDGFETVSSAAKRLGVYPDAVRRAIKAGYITSNTRIGRAQAVFIPHEDLASFDQKYVFIGTLSRQFQAKRTAFSAQLKSAGIVPVSGPGIDGGLVAIFRKADLESHDLAKIAVATKFTTKAGRKKGDSQLYDTNKWMRAAEVGQKLNVVVQQLWKIVKFGLLVEGMPDGRDADNTRFFTAESVERAKQWLDSSVMLAKVAEKEGTSERQIYIRFIESGYVKPLTIAGKTLISKIDTKRIREHRKKYCTCAEAGMYVGSHARHFHNMIKLGKIDSVDAVETEVESLILLRWGDVVET